MNRNEVHIWNPLSITLIGDPFDNYGGLSVASPITACIYIEAYKSDKTTIEFTEDLLCNPYNQLNIKLLSKAIRLFVEQIRGYLGLPTLRIRIDSDLPLITSLGASTAIGVGLARALILLHSGYEPTFRQLVKFTNFFSDLIGIKCRQIDIASITTKSIILFNGASMKVIDKVKKPTGFPNLMVIYTNYINHKPLEKRLHELKGFMGHIVSASSNLAKEFYSAIKKKQYISISPLLNMHYILQSILGMNNINTDLLFNELISERRGGIKILDSEGSYILSIVDEYHLKKIVELINRINGYMFNIELYGGDD